MSERFAWIFDKKKQKKLWCADMWARKAVLAIRTAITGITSRLTTIEGAGYQTASDVSAAIASAIGGITELEYLVVSTLPASGAKGVVYLVPHQHGTRDIYDEYIWVNNAFEKIGNTDVDLSQYLLKTDISAWAKASTKPTYTASEVGALPDTTSIPSKTSDLTNDSGFITGYTETDPTVPAWAKTPSKPTYTASEVGALPDSTVIPGASSATPSMDGTGAAGSSSDYARADHVHPHDTSKADKATTLAGYGITNAYTKTQVDGMIPTVPTNVSAFTNDAGYLTSAPVTSVNSQTGAVNLTAADVGALPSSTAIPSKTSDLTNDSGYITSSAVPSASTSNPAMDGTASPGSSTAWARGDHVHPHDTSKQDSLSTAQMAAVNSGITAQTLNPTTYTTFTPVSSRCTYDAGGYVKVGKLVAIDVTLTMAANIGTGAFTQIAAADAALAPLKGSGYVALNAVNQTSASKATKAKMADNGRLLLHNVAAGDVVFVSGSYVSV